MAHDTDLADILRQARAGRQEGLNRLAERAREKVFAYLYRMTLDYHLAQDLTQETILDMIEVVGQLHVAQPASFWAWLYRTALGKVQHHYRIQGNRRIDHRTVVDHDGLSRLASHRDESGLRRMQRLELFEAMRESLNNLKLTYRNVLVLRCFEQLSYADIAAATGGSELQARLRFLRAKRALARQLSHRGFKRDYFVAGLSLFAALTARRTHAAVAAVEFTTELLSAGKGAAAVAAVASPTGSVVAATCLVALTAGLVRVAATDTAAPVAPYFQRPARIVEALDPDADGWKGLFDDSNVELARRGPFDLATIVAPRKLRWHLLLPEKHSVALEFNGPLADTPGADIRVSCLNTDNVIRAFVADRRGRERELARPHIRRLGNWGYEMRFNLAELNPPFEPRTLRLEGHGDEGRWHAAVLFAVEAKVGTPWPTH